jgi:hypothetical protein
VNADDQSPDARELFPKERELLNALLAQEFDGVELLREQAKSVLGYSSCKCGCGSIGFEHPGGLRPSAELLPQTAHTNWGVRNDRGDEVGGLILFTRGGLLHDLEIYSNEPEPLSSPPTDRVWFMG